MGEEKMSEPHPIHIADDIYALLNHKHCARHQGCSDAGEICGWPEVRKPSPPADEDEGPEKLTWPENGSSRVSKETVEAIVSSETRAYLLRVSGGSFSAEDLMETIQLFFSHSALSQEQLTCQFQRANLRSLQVFVETLKSGVYPSCCFLLGPQQHETVEATVKDPVPDGSEKDLSPTISEKENDSTPTQTGAGTPATSAQTESSTPVTTEETPINATTTPTSAQPCSTTGETYQNAIDLDSDVAMAEKRHIPPQPTPPPAKRPCYEATHVPTQQAMGCSPELADLQQQAWFILQSDVRATHPQLGLERHQLEQSLYFIDYFRRSNGQGAGIDFFTQDRILLERGRQNLETLKAAMQRLTGGFANTPPKYMVPQQPYQQATPPYYGSPSAYHSAPPQMNSPMNPQMNPQTSHPPMMTPPHYAGSPPHPQPPQQPLWSRADYDTRLNYAVQLQKTQKKEEAARRRRYQEGAMQKDAREAAERLRAAKRLQTASKTASKTAVKSAAKPVSKNSVVYNAMLNPATVKSAANPSPSTTSTATTKSAPASFNPMAPVFKPVFRKKSKPLAEPGVVPAQNKHTVPSKLAEGGNDSSKKRLPLLPDLVVKKICSHVNLDACLALADTSIVFRRLIRKADASLVRTKVQLRIPWASLAPSESNYTSWFDFARVVISRAKKMRSGSTSWKRVKSLDSIPRSELKFVDPVDAQGRVEFKPLFDGAFLMPHITQRDGPSLVHLQGNKIFTDHVSVELETFKVKQGVINTKETHLPQKSALFTPRGTKIFINDDDTAIQFVDENNRLLWVKDGADDVFVNKSCAPKNGDGIIMYDRRDASNQVHDLTGGCGKLLKGSGGVIGIKSTPDEHHVCYFPVMAGRNRYVFCLASFSGNGVRDEVFKTLDIVIYNGMLHINLFNTMVPFWTDLKHQRSRHKQMGEDEVILVPAGFSKTMKAFRLADNSRQTLAKTRHLEHSTLRSRCGRFVSASLSRGRVVGDLLTGTSFCVNDDSQDRPNFVFPYLRGQTPAFIRWERSTGISFFNQLSSDLATRGNRASFVMPKIEYNLAEKKKYRFKHYDPVVPELDLHDGTMK